MRPSPLVRVLVLACFALSSPLVVGQDTRGSLVPDAKVARADGTLVDAQDLKLGDEVWVWKGQAGSAAVTGVRRQHTDSFILLQAGGKEFRASGSHRVALAGGKLVRLDTIKMGDLVWVVGPKGPVAAPVTSLRLYPANFVAYDLTIEGHWPFSTDGVVVGD